MDFLREGFEDEFDSSLQAAERLTIREPLCYYGIGQCIIGFSRGMTCRGEVIGETDAFPTWRVGIHTSIAGSFDQAAEKAHHLTCNTFQIFSSSPRMWKSREPRTEEISALAHLRRRYDLHPLVIHANYLLNLASPEQTLRKRSVEAFRGEVGRAAALGAEYLVLHPGSYRASSAEMGIRRLAASIREASRRTPFGGVSLLIENTAGQGTCLGRSFEELRDILALLDGLPAGCCIDTAHCFAAGMDISSTSGLQKIIDSVEQTIGLDWVKVIHTNDSRSALGSRLDRHEHIGKGGIGMEGFRRILNHPALSQKTFILETPLETPGDDLRNMKAIRTLRSDGQRQHRNPEKIQDAAEDRQSRVRAGHTTFRVVRMPASSVRQNRKVNR